MQLQAAPLRLFLRDFQTLPFPEALHTLAIYLPVLLSFRLDVGVTHHE